MNDVLWFLVGLSGFVICLLVLVGGMVLITMWGEK
jgi:hypothetical protein